MSRAIKFSKEDLDKIRTLYTKEGKSQKEIGKIFGVSASPISRVLKEMNISKNNAKIFVPEEIKDIVVDNYVNKKMSLKMAGKDFGYSQKVVETILYQRGVHKRTYVEAKQISRKYQVNDNFFKYQNENMAYLLGFLAADGSISKKENGIFIQLQRKDEDFLEEIRQLVKNDRPLDNYLTNAGNETCKFSVWSAEWKKDLAIYGIVPNKTFILSPPLRLDKKYYIDYIKGYFDGDGCIYYNLEKKKYSFEIVGASKELIEWIRSIFANSFGITNNGLQVFYTKNNTKMYKYQICKKEYIRKIYELFYSNNKKNNLCLKRKKEKFELLFK